MRLGFAVKVLERPDLRSHDTRRWQSDPDLGTSIGYLHQIFEHLDRIDVRMYRMASAIAPYASHPDMPRFRDQPHRFASELVELGRKAKTLGLRLSTHPGQYTVLNSMNPTTVANAIAELEVHAEIMDAMELGPEAVIVLHVGGGMEDKDEAMRRFEKGFKKLSASAQRRLVVENDDRLFGVGDVLKLHGSVGCPVVWDVLHHHCYNPNGVGDAEALRAAASTWPSGVTPKMHYSSPKTSLEGVDKPSKRSIPRPPQLRAHADMVDPVAFRWFLDHVVGGLDIDIMLEAKGKDIALLTLRRQLDGHIA